VTDTPILQVSGIGKRFDLYESVWDQLRHWLSRKSDAAREGLWAVRDVSFEMRRGEVLGLIGSNGAGKSTLVKLITGALDANEGSCTTNGRVFSLPELGTDLNEDLTGRENVLVGAQLLNLPDGYAESRLEQILEFSELGEFFDRRVGTYSTGMRMRLAFSTFAFLESDLLILDEVMAVGDVFFQQKCYQRITQLRRSGTAILMVTHDLNAIQHYCDEVIVMHQGRNAFQGDATGAIQAFVRLRGSRTAGAVESTLRAAESTLVPCDSSSLVEPVGFQWPEDPSILEPPMGQALGSERAAITGMALCDLHGRPTNVFKQGETAVLYFEVEVHQNMGVPVGTLEISNGYNILVHSKNTLQLHGDVPRSVLAGQRLRFCQRIQLGLEPADYVITLGLQELHRDDFDHLDDLTQQDFNERLTWIYRQEQAGALVITFGFGRGLALTHAGMCDLPGECYISLHPAGVELSQESMADALLEG